jgi:hypothetical protein
MGEAVLIGVTTALECITLGLGCSSWGSPLLESMGNLGVPHKAWGNNTCISWFLVPGRDFFSKECVHDTLQSRKINDV